MHSYSPLNSLGCSLGLPELVYKDAILMLELGPRMELLDDWLDVWFDIQSLIPPVMPEWVPYTFSPRDPRARINPYL